MKQQSALVTTTELGLFSHRTTNSTAAKLQAANASSINIETATADELRTYRFSVLNGLRHTLNQGTIPNEMSIMLSNQLALFNAINSKLNALGQPVQLDEEQESLLNQVKAVLPATAATV